MKLVFFSFFNLFAVLNLFSQPFQLNPLGFEYNQLEPHIDSMTMRIHYSKHHQGYVTNLNKSINTTESAKGLSLDQLLFSISKFNSSIRNNAGGHFNHTFFWSILSPTPVRKPSLSLEKAILSSFKTQDSLQKLITQVGVGLFGSGWVWLIVTPDKELKVTTTSNQDNPLMDITLEKGIPILCIDVWEHAYYLKYQNKRAEYLTSIWNVIDWSKISAKYEVAIK